MSGHDSVAHVSPEAHQPAQALLILAGSLLCTLGFRQEIMAGGEHATALKLLGCVSILAGYGVLSLDLSGQAVKLPPSTVFLPFVGCVIVTAVGLRVCGPGGSTVHGAFMVVEAVLVRICAVIPMASLWIAAGVWEAKGFVGNIVVGHLLPSAFMALVVNLPLQFSAPRDRLRLQRREGGWIMCCGCLMLAVHTVRWGGSFLFYWALHDVEQTPHIHWMKDQQHTIELLSWITAGAMALTMSRLGIATGAHLFAPGIANYFVMSSHPQLTETGVVMHRVFGVSFLIAVACRVAFRLVEFSWVGTVAACCFAVSSPELMEWAERNYMPMTYLLLCIILSSALWMFHVCVWHSGGLKTLIGMADRAVERPAEGRPVAYHADSE